MRKRRQVQLAKLHQKQLSVLVIPDDGSRTLEFKLNYPMLLGMGVVVMAVLVIMLVKMVFVTVFMV